MTVYYSIIINFCTVKFLIQHRPNAATGDLVNTIARLPNPFQTLEYLNRKDNTIFITVLTIVGVTRFLFISLCQLTTIHFD